jgi:branched-chain amino acid transport system substrate-binding protein
MTLFRAFLWLALLLAPGALRAQDAVKVGGLLPISGPGAYFGAQDKEGIELALEQVTKSGLKLDFHAEDSACAPLPATQAAKRLLDEFKPAIIIR